MRVSRSLRPVVSFAKDLAREFRQDNSTLVAAAVSFYVFLSLVPLLLLAVAGLGFILGSEEHAYRTVSGFLRAYSPQLTERGGASIRALLEDVTRGRGAATGFGLVTLLWAGSQVFVNLEKAVNIAWGTRSRGFLRGRLVAIVLLFAVGLLLLLSFGVTTTANALQTYEITVFGRDVSRLLDWAWNLIAFFLPLVISIATFTLVYKLLPNTRVPPIPALVGGLIAGILWEGAKHAFSWYVTNFANYSAVYGSLASIILLLAWIYYSSVVTILGAQISALYVTRDS